MEKIKKYFTKHRDLIVLFAIVSIGLILRLYKVTKMSPFDFDQEYAANFAYSVIKEYPIQLVGQGLSVQGLFMAPLYFYYLVPFYFIFSLHPLGGIIGSILLGLITIVAYYVIGKKFFGSVSGLVLAFWRAIFYYKIQADWSVVPSMASELLVIITWYYLFQIWNKKSKFLPCLAFCFGLYTSIHPILFPFYFVFLAILMIKRWLPNIKVIIVSFVAFIVPLTPLILFEILHNFLEVKRLFSLGSGTSEKVNIERLVYHIGVVAREQNIIFGLQLKYDWLLFLIFLVISTLLIVRKKEFWKNDFNKYMLPVTISIFIIYYTLFPTHVPEYYFLGTSVLILFYIGGMVGLLVKKTKLIPIFIIIMIYFTFVNMRELYRGWNYPAPAALYNKEEIVKKIVSTQPKGSEFYVSYIKYPGWNFGFDYLFKYYGSIPQTKEAKQPIYTIVIPKFLSIDSLTFSSGNIGLIDERK